MTDDVTRIAATGIRTGIYTVGFYATIILGCLIFGPGGFGIIAIIGFTIVGWYLAVDWEATGVMGLTIVMTIGTFIGTIWNGLGFFDVIQATFLVFCLAPFVLLCASTFADIEDDEELVDTATRLYVGHKVTQKIFGSSLRK